MLKMITASAAALFVLSTASFALAPASETPNGYSSKTEIGSELAKRRKPRVPGGSGCDDPGDVAEHPECRRGASLFVPSFEGFKASPSIDTLEAKRRKPRVPGGSGCDDPGDVAEHPECRV